MKFDVNALPKFNKNLAVGTPKHISEAKSALSDKTIGMVPSGVRVGDSITMPDADDMIVQEVRTRRGSDNTYYVAACERNGKPGWVALGSLLRVDAKNNPVHPVSVELNSKENQADALNALAGRSIVCKTEAPFEMPKFTNNERDGVETRSIAIAEWA